MINNIFTQYEALQPPEVFKKSTEDSSLFSPDNVLSFDNSFTTPISFDEYPELVSPFINNDISEEEEEAPDNRQLEVVNLARQFLGKPYVWGSADPNKGFDCSGLINYVYDLIGIKLPRSSHAMGKVGKEVELSDVQPGDIIYTSSRGPSGGHVKMVSSVDNGKISVIEAKGKKWGIVESVLTNTSNIKSIRRILDDDFKTTETGKFDNKQDFMKALNSTYRKVLAENNLDPDYSYILTAAAAFESAWGSKISGTFNYGGIKGKTGSVKSTVDWVNGRYVRRNQTFRDFKSVKDYCLYVIKLLQNKRYNAFNTYSSQYPLLFWRHVLDAGYGGGDSLGKTRYINAVSKIYNLIKKNEMGV